jgi:hypothetical protein
VGSPAIARLGLSACAGAPSSGHEARAVPGARRRCVWASGSGSKHVELEKEHGRTGGDGRGDVKCTSSTQAGAASHARVQVRAAALQKYERAQYPEGKRARVPRDAPRGKRSLRAGHKLDKTRLVVWGACRACERARAASGMRVLASAVLASAVPNAALRCCGYKTGRPPKLAASHPPGRTRARAQKVRREEVECERRGGRGARCGDAVSRHQCSAGQSTDLLTH